MTTRRRLMIAILVSWPFAFIYLDWCLYNGLNIAYVSRGQNAQCNGDWRSTLNSCASFSLTAAWIEILVFTAVVVAIVAFLARWVLAPIRNMAEIVGQLGPASLGVRMPAQPGRDETRELSDAIDAMLDRLSEGYDAQRRFAANASHELRTPLATQRTLIEVSLQSALTPEQLDLLSRQLLATNERNEALIDGLLVLAETERGLLATGPQRLDLIMGEAIEMLRPFAEERGVRLDSVLHEVTVPGEYPLLQRLAVNLLQNAVKYNASGGWVQVEVSGPGSLRVANSGPLVPPEQVNGLFEPFRRAGGDRLDHGGGVGLGLTIVRSIVAAHHGSILARPNHEGGLSVDVQFTAIR